MIHERSDVTQEYRIADASMAAGRQTADDLVTRNRYPDWSTSAVPMTRPLSALSISACKSGWLPCSKAGR